MKTLKYLCLSLIISTSFLSCEQSQNIRYEVKMDAVFDIPRALNALETHYFIIRDVPTFYLQSAKNRNIDTSSIVNIQSSRGLIRSSFSDVRFNFVERISVFAVSKSNPNLKREMYYLDFSPLNTGTELRMLNSLTNLKPIISEELVDIEVRMNFRQVITQSVRARIEFGYVVF